MEYKYLILVLGIFVFLHQTEGMFNTGGKNDVSKGWEKSCKNMSKNFDSMSKSLDKILGYIDTLVFTAAIDKKRSDFVSFKLAVQAYKTLFDAFGSSAGSTGSKPNPTELMATINAAFAALNTLAGTMGTSYSNIDASFSTTLATTVPSVEVQTAFSALVSALFTALTALIPYKKVTDEQLSAVLATVATADMTAYLVTFDGSLAIMNAQVTFITGQQKAMSDFQKSVKKSVETFTKDLSKMTKSTKDSKDSGMKNWNGALIKLQGDQKKSGEKIQKGLKANANVDQSAAASIASTKIDAFYVKFGSSSTDVNVLLSAQLSAQYDFSLTQQTLFTDYEVTMISAQVTSVASFLYVNVDGAGQKCLKVMTDQFAAMDKQYQTAQYMCFEDLTTYVSFSTEFINILLSIVKCQSDAVVNYLPACLKQISKKTSSTYNNAMYNTCLSAFGLALETGYDAGLGAAIAALATQATADLVFIQATYNTCTLTALSLYTAEMTALLTTFAGCSPAPAPSGP